MTAVAIRVRRLAASRGPRVAAALAAAALMASLTGAARQPAPLYPVQAAFASPGPLRHDHGHGHRCHGHGDLRRIPA